jgi:hypothetical protein
MKETCKCGATFEMADDTATLPYRQQEFHKQHAGCIVAPPASPRLQIAAMAMQGWLASYVGEQHPAESGEEYVKNIAKFSLVMADALIAAEKEER